jgi:hypothetical protein
MTLDEATLTVNGMFTVHEEVGQEAISVDGNGKVFHTGAVNMSCAPCGERYITITSGGTEDAYGVMFHDEPRAVRWWVYSVEDYAEVIAPREKWGKLHLYWREPPKFIREQYLALDQARILQGSSQAPLTVSLGTVRARLLITKLRPDGTEEPDV